MKIIIVIVVLLAASGGGWWYWNQSHKDQVTYQTGTVTRGDVVETVTATGQLNPVINVTVGSQISGNIFKLHADYNSLVQENEVVAEIDPAPYQAAMHMAEGNLANAQAALELAQLTANRDTELVKEHAAAQADLDSAKANLDQAKANVEIQQANLESAQVNLSHCTITSPIKGIVISRSVDVGQTVAADLNAPVLFTIANDLSKMQIDANVAEADVGQIEDGQTVNFSVDAYPTRIFHGIVEQVRNSPVTTQNVVTYDTVVSVNNDDQKLRPGMTANISVVIAQHNNVLRIPNAALRFRPPDSGDKGSGGAPSPAAQATPEHGRHDNAHIVYVMAPGATKPTPVPVHLGISDGLYTDAMDGVHEGDTVVESVISNSSHSSLGGPMGMRRPF